MLRENDRIVFVDGNVRRRAKFIRSLPGGYNAIIRDTQKAIYPGIGDMITQQVEIELEEGERMTVPSNSVERAPHPD